jgi:hypothetical protein
MQWGWWTAATSMTEIRMRKPFFKPWAWLKWLKFGGLDYKRDSLPLRDALEFV